MDASRSTRRGFTLVELLVVIAIIGVLVGLLLPAVQAAREAARRMSCSNNLKQLGLSLHNYHDVYQALPPLRVRDSVLATATGTSTWNTNNINWAARVLPFMEQQPLHDNLDYTIPYWWDDSFQPNGNFDVARLTVVPSFRCPSDGGMGGVAWTAPDGTRVSGSPASSGWAHINYFASVGPDSGTTVNGSNCLGMFTEMSNSSSVRGQTTTFASVTDGLSNTVALAESVIGFPRLAVNSSLRSQSGYAITPVTGDLAAVANDNGCGTGSHDTSSSRARGNTWLRGYHPSSMTFTTLMAPNSKLWDCHSNSGDAMHAARSLHPGGVQVAVGDGSVRFVGETIDIVLWRHLGGISDGMVAQFP
ncbi:DUF1559 domain-containing protein [Candidatus Laterigemmans baculatus]|uniref:DUF1559 domain-containing protein n=1 Tax=Candidatus Laterigemmans baculatus TaxID=2770505 RepID=UPI0013DCD545|nr:DUF1559 domain-containing protein [Candidatus Laterigemmans baculatus]